jgi:hypothetical protein
LKKAVAILLISMYTFGATEAYQLLKLPILVQHYFQHKQQNASISLLDFLKEHYPEKIIVDDDFAQDMQLPFKTQQTNTLILDVVATPFSCIQQPNQHIIVNTINSSIYNNPYYSQILEKGIFQPPKA